MVESGTHKAELMDNPWLDEWCVGSGRGRVCGQSVWAGFWLPGVGQVSFCLRRPESGEVSTAANKLFSRHLNVILAVAYASGGRRR